MVKTVKVLMGGMLVACVFSICTEMGVLESPRFRNHNNVRPDLRNALREAADDKFILLALNVWNTQIETFAGKPEAVFGYDELWQFDWLYSHQGDPHFPAIFHLMTRSLVKSVTENPSAVIIEEIGPGTRLPSEGIVGFLKKDAQVSAALSPYAIVKTIDFCNDVMVQACRFAVWQRPDAKKP
jgi:hypothetical protein